MRAPYQVHLDGLHIGQVAKSRQFRGSWRYGAYPAYVKKTRAAAVNALVVGFITAKRHVEDLCPACGGTGHRKRHLEQVDKED